MAYKRSPVKTKADIDALVPAQSEYKVAVADLDCLYVKVSPNGSKRFITALTVSKSIALPEGQSRQKSCTHGRVELFSIREIKAVHLKCYEAFKRGMDPRTIDQSSKAELERVSVLNKPIVKLSEERIEKRVARGEIKESSAYNDKLYTRKLEAILGLTSFATLTERHLDQLTKAYPKEAGWSTSDKLKKLITKIYRDLPSDIRIELRKDVGQMLANSFGRIRQETRADQVLPAEALGEVWQKMLGANVNPLFKDAWVLMLLTGARKNEVLSSLCSSVQYERDYPSQWCLTTKGDKDGPGTRLIPAHGVLAVLLDRVIKQGESRDSQYLLPSPKTKSGHLTSIDPLIDEIGGIGTLGVRSNPHSLRRTIADLAAGILGSRATADEHLLHQKQQMKGSARHYFAPESKQFAEKTRETFVQIYRMMDDLILSSGRLSEIERGMDRRLDEIEERSGSGAVIRDSLTLCDRTFYLGYSPDNQQPLELESSDEFLSRGKVWSPIASFCAGEDKFVSIQSRPMFKEKLINEWANFGEIAPRDIDAEFE